MVKGKLIVIESGIDGSGKSIQFKLLHERLKEEGFNIHKVKFPDYESDSSALVRMYLEGSFGDNPQEVNLYAVSAFYAVDRFASYQLKWKKLYESGAVILADRYSTSNMIYQAAKIGEKELKKEYLEWLRDLEFNKFALPEPDLVIFLDMPPRYSFKFIQNREEQDIHERDRNYLLSTYEHAVEIARNYDWAIVNCEREGELRSIEDIHQEVYERVIKSLKGV